MQAGFFWGFRGSTRKCGVHPPGAGGFWGVPGGATRKCGIGVLGWTGWTPADSAMLVAIAPQGSSGAGPPSPSNAASVGPTKRSPPPLENDPPLWKTTPLWKTGGGGCGGNEPSDLSAFQGNHGIWPPGTPRKNLLRLRPGRAEVSVKALRTDGIAFQEITGPGRGNRARASGSLRPSLACHGAHAEIPWNPRRSGATALPGGSWAAGDSLTSAHGPRGSVGKSPTNRRNIVPGNAMILCI